MGAQDGLGVWREPFFYHFDERDNNYRLQYNDDIQGTSAGREVR